MLIILQSDVSDSQVEHVLARVAELGFKAHLSRGTYRTIIGLIGDEQKISPEPLKAIPGVQDVVRVLPPYKLASREAHPQPSVVDVSGVKIGGGHLAMIAGPCAVEEPERMDRIAEAVKAAGANIFRGGAYKPRTSPYAFQGLGEEGLKILREVGDKHGLPVVTEVMDPRCVPAVEKWADMIQIGARNMQNFSLLRRAGKAKLPVLLKRGLSATLDEWLLAAEYIMAEGNYQIVLCERGIRTFAQHTRNTLDLAAIPAVRRISHLPVLVDPSHGTGKNFMVTPLARAGVAVGADGLIVEVHDQPEHALSDGAQALTLDQYEQLVTEVRSIHEVIEPVSVS